MSHSPADTAHARQGSCRTAAAQFLRVLGIAVLLSWLCAGCGGTAVIADATQDRVIVETHHADQSRAYAEARKGCGFYGRPPVFVGSTCLDSLCQRQRVEFSCQPVPDVRRKPSSPWLGLSVMDVADHLYADPPGSSEIVVSRVFADGPARAAGLQVGDIIESINGRNISSAAVLAAFKNTLQVGDQVSMGIRRGRDRLVVDMNPE